MTEENMLSYYKELFLYIKRLVQDKDFTSEIVQETFSRAILAEKKMTIKNKRAFLYRIAKNLIVDESRKASNKYNVEYKEELIADETLDIEELIITQDQSQTIYKLIAKLPKKRKQAFVLYAIEGYTRKEISLKLGVSANAIEKHITRSIVQIKEEYNKIENNKEVL